MAGSVLFYVVTTAINSAINGGKYCDLRANIHTIPLSWNSPVKFSIHFRWKVNIGLSINQVMKNSHLPFPKCSQVISNNRNFGIFHNKVNYMYPFQFNRHWNFSHIYRSLMILMCCLIVHQVVMHWVPQVLWHTQLAKCVNTWNMELLSSAALSTEHFTAHKIWNPVAWINELISHSVLFPINVCSIHQQFCV